MQAIETAEKKSEIVSESQLQKFIELTLGPQLKGIPKEQIMAALQIAKINNLNPWKREVYFIPYDVRDKNGKVIGRKLEIVTSYTVYISRAAASGLLNGYKVEVDSKGSYAKVQIWRKDWDHPFEWGVFKNEVSRDTRTWREMPKFMLRKVVISQGFRLAFPEVIAGLPYTQEELLGIDNGSSSSNDLNDINTPSENLNGEVQTEVQDFIEKLFEKYPELAIEVVQKYIASEEASIEDIDSAYSLWHKNISVADKLLPEFATEKQRRKIKADIKELGWDKNAYRAFLKNTYGVSSSLILSKEEASDCISRLSNLKTVNKGVPEEFNQFENCEVEVD